MIALGVIPARGGSKGVPRKNIRPLAGRALIAYTIDACRRSRRLARFVVSTDDNEIAAVASDMGVPVVRRPPALATDHSRTEDALLHVLDELGRTGFHPDVVATLEPTSPLRRPETIDACIERLAASSADAVVTVVEDRSSFGRLRDGAFEPLVPNQPRRRQEREPLYKESSTVWVTRVPALRATKSVLGARSTAVAVTEEEAIDINTELDFAIAEAVLTARNRGAAHA